MPPQVGQTARRSLTLTEEHVQTLSVHATKPVTQLGIVVKRQTGESVLEAEAWCYTLRPDASVSAGATGAAATVRS